jgi:hypothetical protein
MVKEVMIYLGNPEKAEELRSIKLNDFGKRCLFRGSGSPENIYLHENTEFPFTREWPKRAL